MSVRRIFVEKKPEFAVLAHDLKEEIASYLGIDTITDVRVLIRYDIEDVSEDTYQKALITIFSEPPVDFVYEEGPRKAIRSFPLSSCRDSSIREPIPQNSV